MLPAAGPATTTTAIAATFRAVARDVPESTTVVAFGIFVIATTAAATAATSSGSATFWAVARDVPESTTVIAFGIFVIPFATSSATIGAHFSAIRSLLLATIASPSFAGTRRLCRERVE